MWGGEGKGEGKEEEKNHTRWYGYAIQAPTCCTNGIESLSIGSIIDSASCR